MAEVGKLSASKLTTYKGCSLAYYLQYVAHEKVPTAIRMVFGKEIHYMLEKFYKKNYKSPETFVNSFFYKFKSSIAGDFLKGKEKENLIVKEIPYTIKNSKNREGEERILRIGDHVSFGNSDDEVIKKLVFGYGNLGASICKRFFIRHKSLKPPIRTEMSFGVKKTEPFEINGHFIRGVFDRIDKNPNGYYITDYKTDKSSPGIDSFILHRHPQFTLYSYAFRELFERKEKAILYYHLRSGDIFKTHRSEKDYDYIKKLLDEVAEGIDKDVFVPFYGFHCNFCDYKAACEKYSIPHHGGPRIDLQGKIKGAEKFSDWDVEIPDWMEMQVEER